MHGFQRPEKNPDGFSDPFMDTRMGSEWTQALVLQVQRRNRNIDLRNSAFSDRNIKGMRCLEILHVTKDSSNKSEEALLIIERSIYF